MTRHSHLVGNGRRIRWAGLLAASSGLLLASTCDAVFATLDLAFRIVDVWV